MATDYQRALHTLRHCIASDTEQQRFAVRTLSEAEWVEIAEATDMRLPAAYYEFIRQIGVGEFFLRHAHQGMFCTYGADEMRQNQRFLAEHLLNEGINIDDEYLMVGVHQSMGDWMGFNLARADERCFDVYDHAAPVDEYTEIANWRRFEEWVVAVVASNGVDSL